MIRALYVDDNLDYRTLITRSLEQIGIKTLTASSGNEAISLIRAGHSFDLIVSDYKMPDGNGAELFAFLKQNNIFSLFILYTNYGITAEFADIFKGRFFLKIVLKHELQTLLSEIVFGLTAWTETSDFKS